VGTGSSVAALEAALLAASRKLAVENRADKAARKALVAAEAALASNGSRISSVDSGGGDDGIGGGGGGGGGGSNIRRSSSSSVQTKKALGAAEAVAVAFTTAASDTDYAHLEKHLKSVVRAIASTMSVMETDTQRRWLPVLRESAKQLRVLFAKAKSAKKIAWLDQVEKKATRREAGWESATEDDMSNTDDSDKYLSEAGTTEKPVKHKKPSKERHGRKRKAPTKPNAPVTEKVPCPWCDKQLARRSLKRHQKDYCHKSGKQQVPSSEDEDAKSASPPPSPPKRKRQARKKAIAQTRSSGSDQPLRSVRTRACKRVVRSTSKRTSARSSASEGDSRSSQSEWVASAED